MDGLKIHDNSPCGVSLTLRDTTNWTATVYDKRPTRIDLSERERPFSIFQSALLSFLSFPTYFASIKRRTPYTKQTYNSSHYKQDTYTTNQPGAIKNNTPPPLSTASQSHQLPQDHHEDLHLSNTHCCCYPLRLHFISTGTRNSRWTQTRPTTRPNRQHSLLKLGQRRHRFRRRPLQRLFRLRDRLQTLRLPHFCT